MSGRAAAGFDWGALMRAGMGQMGLAPRDFWDLTPVEFLILSGVSGGPGPLDRDAFGALCARFPDTRPEDDR